MNSLRLAVLVASVTGAVLAPAAVARGAPVMLASEAAPTLVAAWNGTVMWSRFDPATELYSLVKSVDGAPPVPVGVAPRSLAPFDIDLGTNRFGATYAVYTRQDGDIYRLNVATGTESKLEQLSMSTLVEREPTIQRGEIAFVRHTARGDELRIGNTTRGSTGSRLLVRTTGIFGVELGTSHVAYLRAVPASFGDERVHVRNLRSGADRMVYQAVSGGANAAGITRPSFVARPAGFCGRARTRARRPATGSSATRCAAPASRTRRDRRCSTRLRGPEAQWAPPPPCAVRRRGPLSRIAAGRARERDRAGRQRRLPSAACDARHGSPPATSSPATRARSAAAGARRHERRT